MELDPGLLSAGTTLGRYRLEALLGQGAFGAVYRAVSTDHGARVALKILGRRAIGGDATIARFHREAELVSRLRHPNSVRVLDRGEAEGWNFIAFELLDGESLEALVERTGRVAPERAMEIAIQILDGLEEAHGIGLVHRDLKPANILLVGGSGGLAPRVKIVDFGLAKSTNPGTLAGLTQAGTTVGTPLYMSPEQILGNDVGPPTDLFSLGVVLAEMIHGGSLYPGDAAVMSLLTERIAGRPVPIPPELAASPLRAVVERATRPDPRDRFADAASMRSAIARVRGAVLETSRVASAATQSFVRPASRTVDVSDLIANRTLDVGPLGANATVDVSDVLAPHRPASAPATRATAAPPRRSRGLLVGGIVGGVVIGAAAVVIAIVVATASPTSSTSSTSASAKRGPPPPPPPPRSPAQAASATPVQKTDWLVDPRSLIGTLKSRFASDRVQAIQINEDQAYVTVEAKSPNTTVLYVVTPESVRAHADAKSPWQPQPLDLTVLDHLPAVIADATKLARDARRSTTIQFISVTCRSCRNDGGGFSVSLNDHGSNRFEVLYDLAGRFVFSH